MWKKLTEQRGRSDPFTIYVDLSKIAVIHSLPSGMTRLRFTSDMTNSIDVVETITDVIDEANSIILTDAKDDTDGGSRDENGGIANNPIEPNSKTNDNASLGTTGRS